MICKKCNLPEEKYHVAGLCGDWDIALRVIGSREEAWVHYKGKTIMIFDSNIHTTGIKNVLEKAQKFVDEQEKENDLTTD